MGHEQRRYSGGFVRGVGAARGKLQDEAEGSGVTEESEAGFEGPSKAQGEEETVNSEAPYGLGEKPRPSAN